MQPSSVGCSIALQVATKLSRVQRSLEGCDRWGEARGGECYISKPQWSSEKIFDPGGPSSGLKEALVSEIVNLYFLADEYEAAKLRWAGGRASPCLAWQCTQKDGRAREAKTH